MNTEALSNTRSKAHRSVSSSSKNSCQSLATALLVRIMVLGPSFS